MFSLFNFSSIFQGGQLTPFAIAPMCGRPWIAPRTKAWLLSLGDGRTMAEVGKGVDSAVLWRFLTVTALHKSAYLLTHLLSLHKGVTNASAYQPIGLYRRSKHSKSLATSNVTHRLLDVYFQFRPK